MTTNFNSLHAFAAFLISSNKKREDDLVRGLEQAGRVIRRKAKSKFGKYQKSEGPFPMWKPLALATVESRARAGATPNEPLLVDGKLRESIDLEVDRDSLTLAVGSTSDIMVYQELGTDKIPPRPVLGPAALQSAARIRKILGAAAVAGLLPKDYTGAPGGPDSTDYESNI